MSERLMGAVVGMHSDDNGLIIPPAVAPFHIVLMPIASHIDENVNIKILDFAVKLSDMDLELKSILEMLDQE